MKIGLSLFAVAAAALLAVGCGGDKGGGEDEANYDGWMLTRWKDGTALTGTVYLQLGEDGTFTLYQSIGTFGYARFTGTLRPCRRSGDRAGAFGDLCRRYAVGQQLCG